MEFVWGEGKDAANQAKHGISLGEAVRLDWDAAFDRVDRRADYGETRKRALVPMNGRIYFCAYTIRDGVYRIISLRKANDREARQYDNSRF